MDILHLRGTLRESLSKAVGPKKRPAKVMATTLWCLELCRRLGAISGNLLEKHFEAAKFGQIRQTEPSKNHKWSRYLVGQNVPGLKQVMKVEKLMPGYARLFFHPIWDVIDQKVCELQLTEMWLGRLSAEVQNVVFDMDSTQPSGSYIRRPIKKQWLPMLERRAGIDALACLTIFYYEAEAANDQALAFELGLSMFRTLQMVCTFEPFSTVGEEFFDFYRQEVLDEINDGLVRIDFNEFNLTESLGRLDRLLHSLARRGVVKISTPKQRISAMYRLIAGDFGHDARCAFSAPLTLVDPVNCTNHDRQQQLDRHNRRRAWGIETLDADKWGAFLPMELLKL